MLSESDQRALLAEVDDLLWVTQKYTSLMLHLQPTNATEQMEIFLAKNGDYAPQFTYKLPSTSLLNKLLDQLVELKKSHIDRQTYTLPCAKLFADKIQERILEAELMLAYVDQDFPNIKCLNALIYGAFDKYLLNEAEHILSTYEEPPVETRWKKLSTPEIIETINTYIAEHHVTDIKIKPLAFCPMKFMLVYQKPWCSLVFPDNLTTREYTLMSNIIHEISVHHQRYMNGRNSGRNLLEYGTALYQKDEEWLAMYQAYLYLSSIYPDFHKTSMYEKYFMMWNADGKSYQEMCNELRRYSPNMSLTSLFKKIVRLYMGIQNTAAKDIPLFLYNKIYLDGFTKIQKRHQQWNDLHRLFAGKIKIEDIDFLGQMPDKRRLS